MAAAPCRTRGDAARGRLAHAGGTRVHRTLSAPARLGDSAVEVDVPVGGDEAHLQLAGAPALADDEVAQAAPPARGGRRRRRPRSRHQLSTARRAALPRSDCSRQSSTCSMRSHEPGAWKPQTSSPAASVPNENSSLLR